MSYIENEAQDFLRWQDRCAQEEEEERKNKHDENIIFIKIYFEDALLPHSKLNSLDYFEIIDDFVKSLKEEIED